ncbi:MAG: AAA family ATPase [Candidatus Omnitrophica bacterium]|nr:AAA family ATPase [Candidatus Omnitrophota bacterium]
MKKLKNIFISSIYQNAGKTTVSLGLYKIFREKNLKTAFLKPVGQQTVRVQEQDIDKDSYLIGQVYQCQKRLKEMSPVTIGHGYTEQYILSPQKDVLREKIEKSFQSLSKGKDAIIIEGTGHAGVGSVIDLSNAEVASMLKSKVLMVCEGGIGRSIDEIMLNKALFDLKGVEIVGIIVNKVLPEKYDRIKKILERGLANQGLRLLGVIPMDPLLSAPTVGQVMNLLNLELVCGKQSLNRRVKNTIVAAMEPYNMVNYLKDGTMVLTSGDRVDNIMVAVSTYLVMRGKRTQISGIILTGGLTPNTKILELLEKSKIPVLISSDDTYTIAGKIENLICKIQRTDRDKILEARQLVRQYVDVEEILKNL